MSSGISLNSFLPSPKNQVIAPNVPQRGEFSNPMNEKKIPPYGKRKGWIPRHPSDFGDGGAFPEIHISQYPLGMGNKPSSGQQTVPINVDSQGRIKFDAIINPGNSKALIQSRNEDLREKKVEEEDLKRPDPEEEAQILAKTKAALEKAVNGKIQAAQPSNPTGKKTDVKYIRYTPSQTGDDFNSGAKQRIIKLTEVPVDPLEPPKFKHKKVPRGPPSPPVPVMHSPPRKITQKDQQDWKIPPCISNWKNNKGYTIPLAKRLAADGRGLQEVQINDNFAKLSEALYITEQTARIEVEKRAEIRKRLDMKEKEKKEELLRRLAQEARAERTGTGDEETEETEDLTEEDKEARKERDLIREERRRERERALRMQRNKSAAARNLERDVSEKIALGLAMPQQTGEIQYDQRLFNQTEGMDSGFGDEDSYNIYTKPLFQGSSASQVYRPKKIEDSETYGTEEDLKKLKDTSKFRPDKGFSGTERDGKEKSTQRTEPVQFEKESEDLFGLDEFMTTAKRTGEKLEKIGQSHLHAASSSKLSTESGSKRSRLEFTSSKDSEKDSKRNRH